MDFGFSLRIILSVSLLSVVLPGVAQAQTEEELEVIESSDCSSCHEQSPLGTGYLDDLSHSIHIGLECLDCHPDRSVVPHSRAEGRCETCWTCRTCHDEAAEQYVAHGRSEVATSADAPHCDDCHGDHDILPSRVKRSRTHPTNLPQTCGECHQNLDITTRYEILIDRPIEIYENSVHGKATRGGIYVAATCNDCHSLAGNAHRIYSPGHPDSSINHFNIPKTCGACHKGVEGDFWEGIHGQLVSRGETDAPVCTHCHGEHGIVSPGDPRSPVSRSRVAEETCSPCHESAVLNEKYGLPSGKLATFIDSYHGLKSRAGDTHVANCASCHGVHRILPSSDPTSTVHPSNLQTTCGECHPGISEKLAAMPIHGMRGEGLRTTAAEVVEDIYIVAIVVIIGLMVLHWLIDLYRQIRLRMAERPQIQRMFVGEVWQHTFLMLSFLILVLSGFGLRYNEGWVAKLFFGWEGGFEIRGSVHRGAAIVFSLTVLWHTLFVALSSRGRQFLRDMMPKANDFSGFVRKILFNLGRRVKPPRFGRFSYIEKAEYWALVWGTLVMMVTGALLWFDNVFIQFMPKGILDIALVVHFWEAWLATLAIFVWHLYATVFNPHVYPMNPSWLTGTMPESMYEREHPEHLESARVETEEYLREKVEKVAGRIEEESSLSGGSDQGGGA